VTELHRPCRHHGDEDLIGDGQYIGVIYALIGDDLIRHPRRQFCALWRHQMPWDVWLPPLNITPVLNLELKIWWSNCPHVNACQYIT